MQKVFITDGVSPATPAIMESLYKSGSIVCVGESFRYNVSFFSRYCKRKVVYPNPDKDPEKFKDFLISYLVKNEISCLFPVRPNTIEPVIKYKNDFISAGINFLIPDYETWLKGELKHLTLKIANDKGIPIPETIFKKDTLYEEIIAKLTSPFIIKVSKSSGARGILRIHNKSEFIKQKNYCEENNLDYVFQELIPLGGKSVNASYLFDFEKMLKAWFLMEKVRQYPLNGGSTSFAVSIYDKDLLETGKKLMEAIGWQGVAEVEFIQDPRTGKYLLLEVNPRFWNPLLLAIKSGVDYPNLILQILDGKSDNIIFPEYKNNVKFSFSPYELINLLKTRNINIIKDFFNLINKYDNFIKLRDPGLFIGLIAQLLYFKFKDKKYLKRTL